MRHMAVHFVLSGITLRHLTDWALFVAGSRSRIDWTEFRTAVREAGMQPFADCVQALCVDCLGMEPAWVPPFRRHASLERRMLDDVCCGAAGSGCAAGGRSAGNTGWSMPSR